MKCINHPEKDAEIICKSCVERKYKEKVKTKEGVMKVFFHFLCSLFPGVATA